MTNIMECQKRYRTNPYLLKRSCMAELSRHKGNCCVCSSSFTRFMMSKRLGEAPITTNDIVNLMKTL